MTDTPWMDIATREIGVKELPGAADNPRILEYHQHTSLHAQDDETPWCAAFVNWTLDQAKLGATHRANARSFLSLPKKCEPKFGAVAILWRAARNSSNGHVGFVTAVDKIAGTITLLGGNQGDSVSIAKFPLDRLIECRWPA